MRQQQAQLARQIEDKQQRAASAKSKLDFKQSVSRVIRSELSQLRHYDTMTRVVASQVDRQIEFANHYNEGIFKDTAIRAPLVSAVD